MTAVVAGAFLACWAPVNVVQLVAATTNWEDVVGVGSSWPIIWDSVTVVALAASAVDPLVYNFYSGEFRRAARRVMTCNRLKSTEPFY